jgi:hypothetical protein
LFREVHLPLQKFKTRRPGGSDPYGRFAHGKSFLAEPLHVTRVGAQV